MFPKFICVFTHRHSRGWHRDWAGKNKWEPRALLITYVSYVRFPKQNGEEFLEYSPNPGRILGWG